MAKARNTATHRICPSCQGAGYVTEKLTAFAGPDDERDVACDHPGCEDGWVRTAPVDPLDELKTARARYRRCWPTGEYAGKRYGEVRQRAVSLVCLPHDFHADPLYRQAVQDCEAAIRNFRAFDSAFESIFGRAA